MIKLLLGLTLILCSCSSIRQMDRDGKDIKLNSQNAIKLAGTYANIALDTAYMNLSLYNNLSSRKIHDQPTFTISITPIDKKSIAFKVLDNDTVVDSLTVKGRYKAGYFKLRRRYRTNFIFGPLLWILSEELNYLGLTEEGNLVIGSAGGGGLLLLIAFPIFAADRPPFENEYRRTCSFIR